MYFPEDSNVLTYFNNYYSTLGVCFEDRNTRGLKYARPVRCLKEYYITLFKYFFSRTDIQEDFDTLVK